MRQNKINTSLLLLTLIMQGQESANLSQDDINLSKSSLPQALKKPVSRKLINEICR